MPTQQLFKRCQDVMEKLPSSSRLRNIHYDLFGILKCIEEGPNIEEFPDYKTQVYERYYEWYAWKKFTTIFTHRLSSKNISFQQMGMVEYISRTLKYLEHLQLLK